MQENKEIRIDDTDLLMRFAGQRYCQIRNQGSLATLALWTEKHQGFTAALRPHFGKGIDCFLQLYPRKRFYDIPAGTGFDDMAQMCMAFEEVDSVYLMAGVYDFALIVRGETMQDVAMFVAKKLSTVDGVLSTSTHFIMRRYKDRGMNLFGSDNQADERSLIL